MGTSPDVGGRSGIGRPLVPQYEELEATARVQVGKQGLGIVPNTIEIVFTQMGGNIWRYEAQASKPKLPMDVLVAVTHPDAKETPSLEKQIFEKLVHELPLKLSLELQRERKKRPHERDPVFVVLEQILQFAARAERWLRDIAENQYPIREERVSFVAAFPLLALQGWVSAAKEIVREINPFSRANGIDAGKYKKNEELIKPLISIAESVLYSNTEEKRAEATAQLIEQAMRLEHAYLQKKLPILFQLIGKMLSPLVSIATALSYNTAAPALIHLSFGMQGAEKYRSFADSFADSPADSLAEEGSKESGWVDVAYRKIALQLAASLAEATEIEKRYIPATVYFLMTLYSSLVAEAAGAPSRSKHTTKEQTERIRSLAFALASTLIAHSKVIHRIAEEIVGFLISDTMYQQKLKDAMVILSLSAPILAGSKGDQEIHSMQSLMQGIQEIMQISLESIRQLGEETRGSPLNKQMGVAIRQAILSWEKLNSLGYLESIEAALKPFDITLQSSQYESEQVVAFAVSLLNALYRTEEQEKFTSIVRQAA